MVERVYILPNKTKNNILCWIDLGSTRGDPSSMTKFP